MPGAPPGFCGLSPRRQTVILLAGHSDEPSCSHENHRLVGGLALPTKSACTFIILTQVSRDWGVVLFGFTTREQQEQKTLCRASQVAVRMRYRIWALACTQRVWSYDCLGQRLDIFLLTKAVSAESSFLPDTVYAVWETSLKYIGKRLLLFCQYKPCLH